MTGTPAARAGGRPAWVVAALLALALIAGHATRLPAWLEDIDSVNFALGVRDFDVAQHRPHPPGYPVYIALGKVAAALTGAAMPGALPDRVEGLALAALSLVAAVLLVPGALLAFAALGDGGDDRLAPLVPGRRAVIALTLLVASPLVWHLAARPMSDMLGLAAATAAQAALLAAFHRQRPIGGDRRLAAADMAASGRLIVAGALATGVAIGVRSQVAWLTLPLLLAVIIDRIGRGAAGALLGSVMTFTLGVLAWGVPLIVASGGPAAYLAALGSQAGEDFDGVDMLSLNPSLRLLLLTLTRTFVWPWEQEALAAVVLLMAAAGVLVLLVSERRTLVAVTALTVPYLAFHMAFHDTTFTRYALPLVVPTVFLAATALDRAGRVVAVGGTLILSGASLFLALPTYQVYAAQPSPMVRAFDLLAAEAAADPAQPLALHYSFRRPLEAETRPVGARIDPTPRREWLDLGRHWLSGGGPLRFLADPLRTDLALIDPQARRDVRHFTWDLPGLSRAGGMRPIDADLYRMPVPGWFVDEGWALTPETAGMARLMGRGPHLGPITAHVRRRPGAVRLLVGGRNLGTADDPAVRVTLTIDGTPRESWDVAPGFFLRTIDLPAGALQGEGVWSALTLETRPVSGTDPVPAAIEQFDVQDPGVVLWGFDEGWHEAEFSPVRLERWRWMSARAVLRVEQATAPLTLVLRGDSPLRDFAGPSTLTIRVGSRQLARVDLQGPFTVRVGLLPGPLAEAGGRVELTTSQTFVPAERDGVPDRRALGLRLLEVTVRDGLPGSDGRSAGAADATSR